MSGGHFNYTQYHMDAIADNIDEYINGRELTDEDIEFRQRDHDQGWIDEDTWEYWNKRHHTVPNEYGYSQETIDLMKEGLKRIREASVYAQRIDWLLSGDDGEEEFARRLKEELKNLK